jgi:hypothetical protein
MLSRYLNPLTRLRAPDESGTLAMNVRKRRLSELSQKIKSEDEIITEYCNTILQVPMYTTTVYVYFVQYKFRQKVPIGSVIFLHPSDKL